MEFDFSLILCTLERVDVVDLFLKSLSRQDESLRIELIVVDQNTDNRLDPVLAPYAERYSLKHLRTTPGLSRARNLGLKEASGAIICFPDDDCTYPPELLKSVHDIFRKEPQTDGISACVTDEAGKFYTAGGQMFRNPCPIDRKNVWWCGVSVSIFFRRQAIDGVFFDESLGVGSGTIFGSGEETDYLLSLLKSGKRLSYRPDLIVHHPRFNGPWSAKRGMRYGCGMGRVLRKHGWSFFTAVCYACLQLARSAQSALTFRFSKMCYHLAMSAGRIRGYLAKVR